MANYNVGDIIRLTRLANGISQEKLSDGICSVQTLSRIENGKVNVKKKTYRQLMERMGRNGQTNYSLLSLEELETLESMFQLNTLLFRREYDVAEKYTNFLKEKLDLNDIINMQYIMRAENNINYYVNHISDVEYIENMEKILSVSIMDYRSLLNKKFPFRDEETQLLMNIATGYNRIGQKDVAISIYYMLIRSLNTGYMQQSESIQLIVILIGCLAKTYGGLGKHDIAIRMCENAITKSKKYKLFSIMPNAYAEMAWNMMKQIEKGERNVEQKADCKKLLRQGYAIASLSKQESIKKTIEVYYRDTFNEDIYLLVSSRKGELSLNSCIS